MSPSSKLDQQRQPQRDRNQGARRTDSPGRRSPGRNESMQKESYNDPSVVETKEDRTGHLEKTLMNLQIEKDNVSFSHREYL